VQVQTIGMTEKVVDYITQTASRAEQISGLIPTLLVRDANLSGAITNPASFQKFLINAPSRLQIKFLCRQANKLGREDVVLGRQLFEIIQSCLIEDYRSVIDDSIDSGSSDGGEHILEVISTLKEVLSLDTHRFNSPEDALRSSALRLQIIGLDMLDMILARNEFLNQKLLLTCVEILLTLNSSILVPGYCSGLRQEEGNNVYILTETESTVTCKSRSQVDKIEELIWFNLFQLTDRILPARAWELVTDSQRMHVITEVTDDPKFHYYLRTIAYIIRSAPHNQTLWLAQGVCLTVTQFLSSNTTFSSTLTNEVLYFFCVVAKCHNSKVLGIKPSPNLFLTLNDKVPFFTDGNCNRLADFLSECINNDSIINEDIDGVSLLLQQSIIIHQNQRCVELLYSLQKCNDTSQRQMFKLTMKNDELRIALTEVMKNHIGEIRRMAFELEKFYVLERDED